jgi:hypothetical protein
MIRRGLTFFVIGLCGCTHITQIPHPTDKWNYERIEEAEAKEKATVCLLVNYELDDIGDFAQRAYFFEKADVNKKEEWPDLPPNEGYGSFKLPQVSFFDGKGFSGSSFLLIETFPNHVTIEEKYSYTSSELKYGFDETLTLSYAKTGSASSGRLHCSWEWIELDTPTQWHLLAEKTGVDSFKPINKEPEEADVKKVDDLFAE